MIRANMPHTHALTHAYTCTHTRENVFMILMCLCTRMCTYPRRAHNHLIAVAGASAVLIKIHHHLQKTLITYKPTLY